MTSMITCIATSTAWCFCTASASLLSSCCGNDKASTIPPGPNSGRKRSVLLLMIGIAFSLVFQHGLSQLIMSDRIIPSQLFLKGYWLDQCVATYGPLDDKTTTTTTTMTTTSTNDTDTYDNSSFVQGCVANQANYRVSLATTLFFLLAGLAALCKRTANREAWPAKFTLYLFLVAATIFIPADPFVSDIYLYFARAGGALFILFQQIVIVDVAYNWNESWVEKSNAAENETPGSGKKWLYAILFACTILFCGTVTMLLYTIIVFRGCHVNHAIIAVTVLLIIAICTAQLSGEEGSLLASACVAAWASYLCYAAVSKNPDATCNPYHGGGDLSVLSVVLGVAITMMSLLWTGWSYTAADTLRSNNNNDDDNDNTANNKNNNTAKPEQTITTPVVGGIVTGTNDVEGAKGRNDHDDDDDPQQQQPARPSDVTWRLNLALALIACWAAMILTHWGQVQKNNIGSGDGPNGENSTTILASTSVSKVTMWMIVASQWLCLTLYLWTLIAPRLFPNRDFS